MLFKFRGPKPQEVEKHMKMKNFNETLSKFTESEINEYNLGLGRIFRWYSLTIRCRIGDV